VVVAVAGVLAVVADLKLGGGGRARGRGAHLAAVALVVVSPNSSCSRWWPSSAAQ